ncbi:MAG: EAL domain-containing protein [Lautropia sp.]
MDVLTRFATAVALSTLACLLAQAVGAGAPGAFFVWPASAVAFAFGWRHGVVWAVPAAAGAALWGVLATGDHAFAAMAAAASLAGPVLGLLVLRRLVVWQPIDHRLPAVTRFLAAVLLLVAPFDALVHAGWLAWQVAEPLGNAFPRALVSAWIGDALGLVLVAPVLLTAADPVPPPGAAARPGAHPTAAAERGGAGESLGAAAASGSRWPWFDVPTVLLAVAVAVASHLLARAGELRHAWLLVFAVFPLLAWAAARAGARSLAPTLLMVALPMLAARAWHLPEVAPGATLLDTSLLVLAAACLTMLLHAAIADRLVAIDRVAQQSRQDPTTGLLNDRGLLAEISDALAAPGRRNAGLIGLSLTNFDAIADLCGTIEAIQLEQACADLLRRQTDARFGARIAPGRYVLVTGADTVALVRAAARELYSQLNGQLFQTEHGSLRLQCCAGGLLLDSHTVITSEDCLSALADATSIAASVRDPRLFVEPLSQMTIDARRAHQGKIEHIREAIRDDRIELFAQPVVDPDAPEGKRSYEVLTRLIDPDGNLIQPPEFLTLAATAQMSIPLDRAVVRLAFTWLAANPAALDATWKCSINLSGTTMSDGSIAEFIREQRARHGIPANRIVFEITESEAIRNPAAASRLVDDLKQQGFGIALDDFGTGLATFEYLKRFPLDYLKIDGSFIRNMITNPIDEEIVMSTIRVAARLQLRTVAEHVHNGEICDRLRGMGVAHLQGDFFGKPVPIGRLFGEPVAGADRRLADPA